MKVRFYRDPETKLPHIYKHNVNEDEVKDFLARPGEDRPGHEGSRVAIGRTKAGRYLRVIYVPDAVRGEPVEPPFDKLRANGINLFSKERLC